MKYDLRIPGWMSERDLKILHRLASYVPKNGNILEVGSFVGRSTSALFHGKDESVNLEVVDPFTVDNIYSQNLSNKNINGRIDYINKIKEIANNTGSWLEGFRFCLTPEVADQIKINVLTSAEYNLDKKFDMIFIDGSHELNDVLYDIKKYISEDGLLMGDDFGSMHLSIANALSLIRPEVSRTLIVPARSKIWIMVPDTGYWKNIFDQTRNLLKFQMEQ